MIKINLLPHREEKRKQKKSAFVALMALSAVLGVLVVIAVGGYNARRISIQEERNGVFTAAIVELDKKIAEIANLKQEIEALKARQQAVEDLQGERNQPVYLLDELVRQTPQGVYLKSFKQDGQRVTVGGFAQSQERVAELLRNIAGNSPWLERPDLTEVRAAQLAQSKTGKKVVEFTLNLYIKRQREKEEALKPGQKPAAGATAATGSPAPATAAP
ncbi:fimbrial assembly protein [Massilia sp. CCM 8733]|uniref:Fimbrial assembly protein n=1 Tax=Massilia mucilaginosa TaxID=2609282 RepID=A0ABX0NN60_9BURK|nr:PilN domain-containing protein [Massilia mucilaginosa]NHZ88231.1 fimbrial assembly protein [Massilia mucilaginosa]